MLTQPNLNNQFADYSNSGPLQGVPIQPNFVYPSAIGHLIKHQ